LGSPRLTVDIDFVGDDVHPSEFHQFIMQIAKELKIDVEPVPLDRFIPLPTGSTKRQIRIGQFGNLEIYVADPYSIALSKLDRGFDTDFEDIIFSNSTEPCLVERVGTHHARCPAACAKIRFSS
jgi:hypothetical protein